MTIHERSFSPSGHIAEQPFLTQLLRVQSTWDPTVLQSSTYPQGNMRLHLGGHLMSKYRSRKEFDELELQPNATVLRMMKNWKSRERTCGTRHKIERHHDVYVEKRNPRDGRIGWWRPLGKILVRRKGGIEFGDVGRHDPPLRKSMNGVCYIGSPL
jgi:hypothetical protein